MIGELCCSCTPEFSRLMLAVLLRFAQTYGSNNTLRNNIFAFGGKGQFQLGDLSLIGDGNRPNRVHVEHNIFYWREGEPFRPRPEAAAVTFKGNVYWHGGELIRFAEHTGLNEWRKREPDAVVADPMFVKPGRSDFRVKPDSPAVKAGFVPFDISQAGRLSKRYRTADLPPVPCAFPPAPAEPTGKE